MPRVIKEIYSDTYIAESAVTKYAVLVPGTADSQAKLPGAANAAALGVAKNAAADGIPVEVVMFGPAICIASGAITKGALVAIAGTTGKVASITVGQTTGSQRCVGRALETVTADGDQIAVFVGANNFVAV